MAQRSFRCYSPIPNGSTFHALGPDTESMIHIHLRPSHRKTVSFVTAANVSHKRCHLEGYKVWGGCVSHAVRTLSSM